jgi:hypothetical protein
MQVVEFRVDRLVTDDRSVVVVARTLGPILAASRAPAAQLTPPMAIGRRLFKAASSGRSTARMIE